MTVDDNLERGNQSQGKELGERLQRMAGCCMIQGGV